jgi:hypothetical protein
MDNFQRPFEPRAIYLASNVLQLVGHTPEGLWCATFGRDAFVMYRDVPLLPCDFETKLRSSAFECVSGELQATEVMRLGILYAMPQSIDFDVGHAKFTATNRFCETMEGRIVAKENELEIEYSSGGGLYRIRVSAEAPQVAKAGLRKYRDEALFMILLPKSIKVYKDNSPKPFCIYEREAVRRVDVSLSNFGDISRNVEKQMTFTEQVTNNAVVFLDKAGHVMPIRADTSDDRRPLEKTRQKRKAIILVSFASITLTALVLFFRSRKFVGS